MKATTTNGARADVHENLYALVARGDR